MSKKTTLLVAALCGMVALGMAGQVARGQQWVLQQITDNETDDGPPMVYGSTVAWSRWFPDAIGGTDHWDAFAYDGVSTTRLTNHHNSTVDTAPGEAGIFWRAWDGSDVEVYLHDGASATQITDTDYNEGPFTQGGAGKPIRTSGQNAVWAGPDPVAGDWQIFLYEGATDTITRLTTTTFGDWPNYSEPRIDGTNVVWHDWNGDPTNEYDEIYFYDGSTVTTLTQNTHPDLSPRVSGNNIAWQAIPDDGTDSEIYFYDGSTITRLTDNAFNEGAVEISGSNVVWAASDGEDAEIFLYDGSTITQLTDNSLHDTEVRITGSTVTWLTFDPDQDAYEIFLYDGTSVTQLTDDNGFSYGNPEVQGSTLVWNALDGWDTEIFIARLAGDTDVDGDVDFDDFLSLQLAWGSAAGWANGDFDGDGDVDGDDFAILDLWYEDGEIPAGAPVPEPASLLLLAAGLIPLRARRARRTT